MEKWHKVGIFVVGLIGLVSYIYKSAKETIEEIKKYPSPEKIKKVRTPQEKLIFSALFLVACVLFMFIVPRLLQIIIAFLIPNPEKLSMELIVGFYKLLFSWGENYFNNGSYFFEKQGLMLLEWLFILSPYIIGFMIWSIKMIYRNIRLTS